MIDPAVGLQGYQARKIAFAINIPKELVGQAVKFMMGLYKAFTEKTVPLLKSIRSSSQVTEKSWPLTPS